MARWSRVWRDDPGNPQLEAIRRMINEAAWVASKGSPDHFVNLQLATLIEVLQTSPDALFALNKIANGRIEY